MDVSGVIAVFDGLSKAALAIGAGAVALTVILGGLCTMFGWLDQHIGAHVKRVFVSVLLGGMMMGGGGAFGVWLASTMKIQ